MQQELQHWDLQQAAQLAGGESENRALRVLFLPPPVLGELGNAQPTHDPPFAHSLIRASTENLL